MQCGSGVLGAGKEQKCGLARGVYKGMENVKNEYLPSRATCV